MGGKGRGKNGSGGKPNSASRPAPSPAIAAAAGGQGSTTAEQVASAAHSHEALWQFVFGFSAIAMVVGAIVLVPLMLLRMDTRIVADLVVKRLEFAPRSEKPLVTITDQPTAFEALTIEKFSKVSFRPARLVALNGTPGTRSTQLLSVEPGTGVFIQGDGHPAASVSIAAPEGSRARVGRLESFSTRTPAVITIGTTQGTPATFTISVAGQMRAPSILPSGPFDLNTQHTTLTGAIPKPLHGELKLRAVLSETSPILEIEGGADGFTLTLTVTPVGTEPVHFLGKGGNAIDKVELISQNSHGDLDTALAGNGVISFPDFPDKKSVALAENDALSLEDLSDMSITSLSFSPQQGLLNVKLEGKAGKVRSMAGTTSRDHRPSLLDWLRNSGYVQAVSALFFAILIALVNALHIEEFLHKGLLRFRSRP